MERIRHILHFSPKDTKTSTNSLDLETPEAIFKNSLSPGFKLLNQLSIKEKLLETCKTKYGEGDYIVYSQVNNTDIDGDPYPWVNFAVKKQNSSEIILRIGVLVGVANDMSDQIYISGDNFKQSTILLRSERYLEVLDRQEGDKTKHQTTENWINKKLKSFIKQKSPKTGD